MRLDELHSPSSLAITRNDAADIFSGRSFFKAKRDFFYLLDERGFHQMGSGMFASIFVHPNYDYVFKLFQSEEGYRDFLAFCFANPNNPNLPKFKGRPIKIVDNFYCIRMEVLSAVLSRQAEAIAGAFYAGKSKVFARIYDSDDPTLFYNYAGKRTVDLLQKNGFDEGFLSTLQQVVARGIDKGHPLDIHDGNIMRRGNTLVITDPYGN